MPADCARDAESLPLQQRPHNGGAPEPILAFLRRTAAITRDDPADVRFGKVAELLDDARMADHTALVAAMLKIPSDGRYEAPAEGPEHQRQTFFRVVAELMAVLGAGAPVLICVEDLHWADPTTLEFVTSLVDHFTAKVRLLVATARADARLALAENPRIRLVSLDGLPSRPSRRSSLASPAVSPRRRAWSS